MKNYWLRTGTFAMVGLLVTVISYLYLLYVFNWHSPTQLDIRVGWASTILCPPSLLFSWCIDCEVGTAGGVVAYRISGFLNAILYGLIGSWLKRRETRRP